MKTMNINSGIFCTIALLVLGCGIELEPKDPNNIGSDVALATDQNVKTTLIGGYDAMTAGSFFGGNTLRNSELLAANDEIVFSGTFNDVADIYRKSIITANVDVSNLWLAAYATINIANNVLASLQVVDEDDREQVEGEALFLRGVALFELCQNFALPFSAGNPTSNPGVPIMLVEDRNSVANVPRASLQETYEQIVADLSAAESKLASGRVPGKATKAAAAAFLSRVFLQTGDYVAARDAANRVITSGHYSLMASVAAAFNTSSTAEDVFDIPVSSVDGVNNMVTFYASASNGGRGDVEVLAAHLAIYEAGDARRNLFYVDPGTGDTRVGKWINRFGNVRVLRLAEMYLTRAECNQRLGQSVGATPLADVNAIRNRAGLASLGSVTLAEILQERRVELAHEGSRLRDLKRLQLSVNEGATTYPFDDPKLVFPIPQREINVNSNLVQNQGY